MEGGQSGGSGGPAPFLLKTYEMVDDSATDDIVSWSPSNASFVVWNNADFAARLLPTYFKHNNFSSFIRQLNTYGFRKIDPERWEFANEDFIKGQKHLLKNIYRRKPIHSHSNIPGGLPDAERAALEEEIERLTREKAVLHDDLWRFKQQQSGTRIQLDDLERRLLNMEQRQHKMIAFLQRASKNPKFIDNLVRMAGAGSEDCRWSSAFHKKRRLPLEPDYCPEAAESSFYDNHSSTSRLDIGQVFNRDFCDKLKLELCPAFSESNLVSPGTQSSNEDVGRLHVKRADRMECLSFVTEPLELSDTGASFCSRKNLLFTSTADEGDGLISCHLNLTLASCSMQVERSHHSDRTPNSMDQGVGDAGELRVTGTVPGRKDDLIENTQCISADSAAANAESLQEATPTSNQAPAAPPGRVNDVFWEQFLTERPGSSDTEEASSSLRVNPCDEQPEEKKPENDNIWRNRKDMEKLSL